MPLRIAASTCSACACGWLDAFDAGWRAVSPAQLHQVLVQRRLLVLVPLLVALRWDLLVLLVLLMLLVLLLLCHILRTCPHRPPILGPLRGCLPVCPRASPCRGGG